MRGGEGRERQFAAMVQGSCNLTRYTRLGSSSWHEPSWHVFPFMPSLPSALFSLQSLLLRPSSPPPLLLLSSSSSSIRTCRYMCACVYNSSGTDVAVPNSFSNSEGDIIRHGRRYTRGEKGSALFNLRIGFPPRNRRYTDRFVVNMELSPSSKVNARRIRDSSSRNSFQSRLTFAKYAHRIRHSLSNENKMIIVVERFLRGMAARA